MGPLNNEAGRGQDGRATSPTRSPAARASSPAAIAQPQLGSPTFYEATVLDDVDEAMQVAREETFGPIVPLTRIRDVDEALAIVNALVVRAADRDLHQRPAVAASASPNPRGAGWVNINEGTNYWESHLPFGGRAGSQSGVGRVGGRFSMERFTELKTVILNLG